MSTFARTFSLFLAGLVAAAVPHPAQAQPTNPGFDTDLSGWSTTEFGGATSPGTVNWDSAAARLTEGDSHLVKLEQSFSLPLRPETLSFTLDTNPGFDTGAGFIPDAFEAYLLDANGLPAVTPFRPESTAFFNMQEDGTWTTSPLATFDGTTVTLDVSGLAAGQPVTLAFALVGGDTDSASSVRVDGLNIESRNGPPVADAGDDVTLECATGGTTLDAVDSSDPDGDPLQFRWLDASNTELATSTTVSVDPGLGVHTYTLEVTDILGLMVSDEVDVTVVDTTPPVLPAGPLAVEVEAQRSCTGVLPDVTGQISPTDACGSVASVTQDLLAGATLALGSDTTVTLTATDDQGNASTIQVVVTVIDSDGSCAPVPTDTETDTVDVDPDPCDSDSDCQDSDAAIGGKRADKKQGGCGCDSGNTAALWPAALLLAALIRRRPSLMGLALVASLVAPASARAQSPTAIGEVVVGNIDFPGEVDRHTFSAAPGQRVYLQSTDQSQLFDQHWQLLDAHGRVLLERYDQNDLGAAVLMGGAYEVVIRGNNNTTPAYAFYLADSPILDKGGVSLDTDITDTVSQPGEKHHYTLTVPPGQQLWPQVVATSNVNGLSWRLIDAGGRRVAEAGVFVNTGFTALMGGTYTVEVASNDFGTGDYTLRLHAIDEVTSTTSLGATINHTASATNRDRYTFTANGGERVFVDVQSTTTPNSKIVRLRDPQGHEVAVAGSLNDLGPVDLIAGDWTLEVSSRNEDALPQYASPIGDYVIQLHDVTDLDESLTIGANATTTFTIPGQVARFNFTAATPQDLLFDWVSGVSNGVWWLETVDGRAVVPESGLFSTPTVHRLKAGDYVLTVDPAGDITGPIEFLLFDPLETTASASVGDTGIAGDIPLRGGTHTTSFTALAGQIVTVQFPTSSNFFGMAYEIRDSAGRVVGPPQSWLNPTVDLALAGGTYSVVMSGGPGTWTMDLLDQGTSSFAPSGTALAVDSDIVSTGTSDWLLTLGADATLYFDLVAPSAGQTWQLQDGAGATVFGPVPADAPFWNQGPLDLAAGTYQLSFTGGANHTFRVHDVSSVLGSTINLDEVISNAFITPGAVHEYSFVLAATTEVSIHNRLDNTGLWWRLVDDVGQEVFANKPAQSVLFNDGGRYLLDPGLYTLILDPDLNTLPVYEFSVDTLIDLTQTASLGDTINAVFDTPGQVSRTTFTVTDGQRVFFDALVGIDGLWRLRDSQGVPRFDASLFFGADQGPLALSAGTWTLEVDPTAGHLTPFDFSLNEATAQATPLPLSVPQTASLPNPGDSTVYSLVLSAQTEVYFDGRDLNMSARLEDEVGQQLFATDFFDVGPLTLVPGTYTLTMSPRSGLAQQYDFTLVEVVDTTRAIAVDEVVTEAIQMPGQVRTYTFDVPNDGDQRMAELFSGDPALTWRFVDPVGQPVHVPIPTATEDLNALGLAAGTYQLTLDATNEAMPPFSFALRDGGGDDPYFYYTRFSGSPNVKRGSYDYDGVTFRKVLEYGVTHVPAADGIITLPDGDLLVSNSSLYKIDVETGLYTTQATAAPAYHLSLDPSGTKIWTSDQPGLLVEIPLLPLGPGVVRPLAGDDTTVTGLAFDRQGRAYYTASSPLGVGNFGRIDLQNFTTARAHTNIPAHGMAFDPYTDTILTFGSDGIVQLDPDTLTIIAQLQVPGTKFDQGTTDGQGRAFIADNNGTLVFIDYASSGLIDDPGNRVQQVFLDTALDDIAPMSWLGAHCTQSAQVTNLQPADGTVYRPGETVLISGRVPGVDPTRAVAAVLVNGQPAPSLDSVGNFFAPVTLAPGVNDIEVEWWDRCGVGTTTLQLLGDAEDATKPSAVNAVNALVSATFSDTTWNTETRQLHVNVVAENTSDTPITGPLYMAVGPQLHPRVALANGDGVSAEGWRYIEVLAQGTLAPGESTDMTALVFEDPERQVVRFDPIWLAPGNRPPHFVSTPITRAVADATWSYDADAVDPNGHTLTYTLAAGPAGMTVSGSGLLQWTPAATEVGKAHDIRITVTDGHGGQATQTFVLVVDATAPNVPPVFSTIPPTQIAVATSLHYDAHADDADGDPIVYSLDAAPAGMQVDPVTGVVTWEVPLPGPQTVTLRAEDGRGGAAVQSFTLSVGVLSTNPSGPVITSTPPLLGAVASPWLYVPSAHDPDGDPLSWSLFSGPNLMDIDVDTGRLVWIPSLADVGTHPVALTVSDGEHSVQQVFEITVADRQPNQAPIFVTTAPADALVGVPWVYDAEATDPEGNDVVYALVAGPSGTTVDPDTGVMQFTPAAGDEGTVTVAISATDGSGASTTQASYVRVRSGNGAPTITSLPPLATVVGDLFNHRVTATDPDGDPLRYTLTGGPSGLDIDPVTGVLTWLTTSADAGTHPVVVTVSDPVGASVTDSWDLTVLTENGPPVVDVFSDLDPACANFPVRVCVGASDDVQVASTWLDVDAVPTALDVLGCAWVTPTALGSLSLQGGATDGAGNTGTDTVSLTVSDCSAFIEPDVALLTPGDGVRQAAPVDVTGSAIPAAGTIVSWELSMYPGSDSADAVVLAGGSGDVPATPLALFDTTVLENGLYTLRLRAVDSNGNTGEDAHAVVVDGLLKLGAYDLAFEDASWRSATFDLRAVRAYTTLRKDDSGDFGHGWFLGLDDFAVWTNGPLGAGGWMQEGGPSCGFGAIFTPICYSSLKPHVVVVRWPGGRMEAFDFKPLEGSTFFSPLTGAPAYTSREGTGSTLTPVSSDALVYSGDGNLYADLALTEVYDPTQFVLTDPAGTTYLLDVDEGLLQTVDPQGNRVVYDKQRGIFPDLGAPLTWQRDGSDRIARMDLPDGTDIDYVYDGAGDLVQVIDGEGNVLEFVYDAAHRLVSYNVQGQPPIAVNTYDANGRLQSSADATGVLVTESPDVANLELVTVGPDPGLTTTTRFDADGLVRERVRDFVDADGVSQSYVTAMTYDADYRLQTRTLPTGATESWEYDADGRVTQHIDAGGVVRETVYGPHGQPAERYEGGELVDRTTFDAAGRPEVVYRADGSVARQLTYDALGRPTDIQNGTSQAIGLTYDGVGLLDSLRVPDFSGAPDDIDVVMDGRGQLTSVTATYPSGVGTTQYAYDSNGRLTSITDPRSQVMSFTYDTLGRMVSYTDKLNKTKTWTFDEAGRELSMTNRNTETISRTYDAAGRLATVTGPGIDRELRYDPLGRLVFAREGEHITETRYDEAGPTSVHVYSSNATLGHIDATWAVGHDAAGRLQTLVGPTVGGDDAMSATYDYDLRGRLKSVDEAALGTFSYGYDAMGRRNRLTRPNGTVTRVGYDAAGRATSTSTVDGVDALVHEILTTYDSRGLPETQTDQEGVHTYSHDQRARLVGVDHPDGAQFTDESYTYDEADRRTSSHNDPAGEVVYNDADQLVQDATYTYTYDDEGRRVTRTDRVSSVVTTYSYNGFDQMVSLQEGTTTWSFFYDAMNQRVLVKQDVSGLEQYGEAFVYDGNGTVRASYDTSGNRTAAYLTGFGFGEVLARVDGSGDAYALRDRLGTTVGWLDGAGAVASLTVRDAYGVRNAPGAVVPFGYTGHAEDPTGMVWGRARCYAARTGGWTSEDPVLTMKDRYQYVGGVPSMQNDPTGLSAVEAGVQYLSSVAIGCTVAGGVAALGRAAAMGHGSYIGREVPGVDEPWDVFEDLRRAGQIGCISGATLVTVTWLYPPATRLVFEFSAPGALLEAQVVTGWISGFFSSYAGFYLMDAER